MKRFRLFLGQCIKLFSRAAKRQSRNLHRILLCKQKKIVYIYFLKGTKLRRKGPGTWYKRYKRAGWKPIAPLNRYKGGQIDIEQIYLFFCKLYCRLLFLLTKMYALFVPTNLFLICIFVNVFNFKGAVSRDFYPHPCLSLRWDIRKKEIIKIFLVYLEKFSRFTM